MRSEEKIGEIKAELDNTSRRIFALWMVLERAFPRKTEKNVSRACWVKFFSAANCRTGCHSPSKSFRSRVFSRIILYRAGRIQCTRQAPTSIDFTSYLNRPIYMSAFDRYVFTCEINMLCFYNMCDKIVDKN